MGLHPLLFGTYPVLFLWSANVGEITPGGVLPALLVILVAVAAILGAATLVLRDAARAALAVTPIVVAALFYGHALALLDPLGIPVRAQQLGWLALVVLGAVAATRLPTRRVAQLDRFLTGLAAILVAANLVTLAPDALATAMVSARSQASGAPGAGQPLLADPRSFATTTDAPRRDVYWLILDRYGSDRALELLYGSASPVTPWLREHGFTVLADSHANYVKTALSMATTLNMTHLHRLAALMGPEATSHLPVYDALEDSLVVRQFRALGYRYHHIGSWWNATRADGAADANYSAEGPSEFAAVLYERTALPAIGRTLGIPQLRSSHRRRHHDYSLYGLDALDRVSAQPGPKFVLAHILLPHPPYVFDRDGSFISGREARELTSAERRRRQFDYTNARLQAFFESLIALPPDEQPIIIFQADEGPWSALYRSNRYDLDWAAAPAREIEIKFGIANAWYVPGGAKLGLYPSMTAINTFTVLFGEYFGLPGYDRLPDRVYASRGWHRPYDLSDVTDRLERLRGPES